MNLVSYSLCEYELMDFNAPENVALLAYVKDIWILEP